MNTFGLACLVSIAWLFSNNRGAVDWRLVGTGISLQIAFAALVLLAPGGRQVFEALGHGFVKLLEFTQVGAALVFGDLAKSEKLGFIFAFQVLPTIIFFAALMGVLYHAGIMQQIVRGMAWAITKVMRVSGAETTSVCASSTTSPATLAAAPAARPSTPASSAIRLRSVCHGRTGSARPRRLAKAASTAGPSDEVAVKTTTPVCSP